MSYEAIRTIKGRQYRWLQESYRENGKVKTRYLQYLGPVDPVRKKRSIVSALGELAGEIDGLVRNKKAWEETEEHMLDRAAKQAAEYRMRDWVNGKLTGRDGDGPTLAELDLIARYQHGELKLKETGPRHWELGVPDPEDAPTSHAPAPVEARPGESPEASAVQEAEQRHTDFMLGESEPAAEQEAAPEPASDGAAEPPSEPPSSDVSDAGSEKESPGESQGSEGARET